jgi:hypothetical protein
MLARTTWRRRVALEAIRRELLAMEPRLVFVNQGTMERTLAGTLLPARVGLHLAAGFGALGTTLPQSVCTGCGIPPSAGARARSAFEWRWALREPTCSG